ncbi:unnamed protein product, partial [marine sediment metagenome]
MTARDRIKPTIPVKNGPIFLVCAMGSFELRMNFFIIEKIVKAITPPKIGEIIQLKITKRTTFQFIPAIPTLTRPK